jgi:hypothetical protein
MNGAVTNRASVCAARFRSSWDLAMTSVRIETATNSRPARLAAAVPATVANVLHFSKRTDPRFSRTMPTRRSRRGSLLLAKLSSI